MQGRESDFLSQESQRSRTHSGGARSTEQSRIGIVMEQEKPEQINGVNSVSGLLGSRQWPLEVN